MESLTKTPFWLPILLFYILSISISLYCYLLGRFEIIELILIFLFGLIFFTLIEYLVHRFFFHFKAKSEKQEEIMFTIHGVHHAYPRDKERLVMPIVLSLSLAIVFYFIFKLIIPHFHLIFFSGFLAGYSTYLFIHYAIHAFRPPKNFLKFLWKHHALHHFKSEESAFAVSFPFWDYMFRTMPQQK